MIKYIIACLLLFPAFIQAKEAPAYDYTQSQFVSDEVWEMVKPYLLPSNHPAKSVLDRIFGDARMTANAKSVQKAGFLKPFPRSYSHCTVSHHPALSGYLVKMFTDDQPKYDDYKAWIKRIKGAEAIKIAIDKYKYNQYFKVPKKWIYPLPSERAPKNGSGKNFILVVEDMKIYHKQKNYDRWRSSKMTTQRADAIWILIQENGLTDSIRAFNIPFCHDDKQAFIDTEHHHEWPVHFDIMTRYLSPKIEKHWVKLMKSGGPAKPQN